MEAHDAARALGIKLAMIEVKDQSELPDAFNRMISVGVEGLAVAGDPMFSSNSAMIAELARIHKLPTVFDTESRAGPRESDDRLSLARLLERTSTDDQGDPQAL